MTKNSKYWNADTPTVGHVGMIAQEIMIETHVIIKQQDIKMQQPELIQWEAPQKIKNTQNENDVVGATSISYNAITSEG